MSAQGHNAVRVGGGMGWGREGGSGTCYSFFLSFVISAWSC